MNHFPQHSCRQVAMWVDLMKLCRVEWLSRPAIAAALGVKVDTVHRWVRELVANGVLIERMGPKQEGARGSCPMVYALAEVWGGLVAKGMRE